MAKHKTISIVLAVLTLLIVALLVPLQILGWFAITDNSQVNNFELPVKGEAGGTIIVNGGQGTGERITFLPGEYYVSPMEITNNNGTAAVFSIELTSVFVEYPTARDGYTYPESIYSVPDYYTDSGEFLETEAIMTEELFRRFVSPMTNALQYALYYVDGASFDTGYTPIYMTNDDAATATDLMTAEGVAIPVPNSIVPISGAKTLGNEIVYDNGEIQVSDTVVLNTDGTVTLAPQSSIQLFLVLYFDPYKYCTADIGTEDAPQLIELRNSNPFIGQYMELMVSVV